MQFLSAPLPLRCPHCAATRCRRYGSFRTRDGTRIPRRRCLACGRTWSATTRTPMAYIKKQPQFTQMPVVMQSALTLRRTAACLGIHLTTAFRWRHRLLALLAAQPKPRLHGTLQAGIACFRFSAKGNPRPAVRRQDAWPAGPGDWVRRRGTYAALRPVSVLMLLDEQERCAGLVLGRGMRYRPHPPDRAAFPLELLEPGAGLRSNERPLYFTSLCRDLGIPFSSQRTLALPGPAAAPRNHGAAPPVREPQGQEPAPQAQEPPAAEQHLREIRARLSRWLRSFRGVATHYLQRYVEWFLFLYQQGEAGAGLAASSQASG